MSDSEIINRVIRHSRLSTKAFAESLGLSRPERIYHVQRGRNKISLELARLINDKYPEIRYEWIISGIGEMLTNDLLLGGLAAKAPFISKHELKNFLKSLSLDYLKSLPTISIIPSDDTMRGHTAFEVFDDSMQSECKESLRDGDIAICSPFDKNSIFDLKTEYIICVVFHIRYGVLIRKIMDFNEEKQSVLAVPLNPIYAKLELSLDDIQKIYFVHQALIKYQGY